MRVAAGDDDGYHGGLAALFGLDGPVDVVDVLVDELHVQREPAAVPVKLLHAALVEHHEHRLFELVLLELGAHALCEAVVVLFVGKRVLDETDLVVGAAHEGFDEQLAPVLVTLVPEIGPVGLALPLSQRGGVARLHQACVLVL